MLILAQPIGELNEMRYDKLVRDSIPEIIRANGGAPITHVASDTEYRAKLKEKLTEEVREFLGAENDAKVAEELADILEVVYALGDAVGTPREQLESLRAKKATERGGFKKKIVLEES